MPDTSPSAINQAAQHAMTTSGTELPASPGLAPGAATNDLHSDDSDDEWFTQTPHRGINLRLPTAALLALAVLAGGFWGGALAEKHHESGSAISATTAALLNKKAGRGATTGANAGTSPLNGGVGAAAGPVTTGLLTGVEGRTLYLTDASGNLVKVDVGSSASITRSVSSSLAGLQTGDTVVVRGTTGANGVVTARSITAAAPGVSEPSSGTLKAGRSGRSGG